MKKKRCGRRLEKERRNKEKRKRKKEKELKVETREKRKEYVLKNTTNNIYEKHVPLSFKYLRTTP